LQNQSKIPLIVWICDRFDYCDKAHLDCNFPDPEYYRLFDEAKNLSHVAVVANTAFEHAYAQTKGVNSGTLIIKPSGSSECTEGADKPSLDDRENTIYIPMYHNEHIFMDLSLHLAGLGIQNSCRRHNGLGDLTAYKAIVHLPYSWSTIALFENIKIGIPYFIPSESFFYKLCSRGSYWHQNKEFLFDKKMYKLSEWYNKENRDLFVYFSSWKDLQEKMHSCDYVEKRKFIADFAKRQQARTLVQWTEVIKKVTSSQ